MSALLTEDPPRAAELPPAQRTHRRWPRRIAIILVILVASSGAALGLRSWFVSRYNPLVLGNGLRMLDVEGPREADVIQIDTHGNDPDTIAEIPYQQGGSMRVLFGLSHAGGPSVKITDIEYGADPRVYNTVLEPLGAQVTFRQSGDIVRGLRPFNPFVLHEGDNPHVALDYAFVCQTAGAPGIEVWDDVRFRFEVAGASRWVELQLPIRLAVSQASRQECPPGSGVYGTGA